ncbi:N-acetylmuramoyl-L-alanine amidase [Halobacillus sp. ACCC02827]|uniref:SH3 domain-containing protein n=1 Tax=Halobacillus sp. ACCC02827 TaxID=3052090 RepID=UPI00256FAC22|nr:SH3 domain-containing protein [Halobacillus sp. ACCC02827]WJE14493.1 N-acetylmuramoyl-L-alanine amidase [Halobacillus sp. ACCC02827]
MKKWLFVMVVILTAALFQGNETVFADQAVIQTDNMNVRSGPGTNHDSIGKVHTNESYTIVDKKGDWLKIKWNGKTGWVAAWLTKVKTDSASPGGTVYTTKYDYLRIRSDAGLNGTIKGHLMKGDQVQAQDKTGKWVLITHSGIKGWVHSDYLTTKSVKKESSSTTGSNSSDQTVKGKVKVGTDVLNVRSQGSLQGKVLTQIQRGQTYEYIGEQNRWIHIKWGNGKTGWVAGWLVNKVEDNSSTKADTSITLSYNGTNIRSGPSTNDKILGRAHKGDQFQVLSKEGQWYKISYSGKTAYVAGWIVEESGKGSQTATPVSSGSLNGKTIMIDAGHGGRDPGAIGRNNSLEKNLTLSTAQKLKNQLESKGAKVLMTRTKDEYISLSIRSYYAKRSDADAFVSLHLNSAPSGVTARGINTFYYHSKDKGLATSVQNSVVDFTGLNNRGILNGNFHVLRENNKPAVLVELGFISDAREEQTVRTNQYQEKASQGITQGLINYFK